MINNNIHTILIPDIHGRSFWQEALPFIEQGIPTIFIGDYLDVYSHENITRRQAIENFKKIIEITKSHDNVQLLLGNHDACYALDPYICEVRTDYINFNEIREIFKNNFDLFKLCVKVNVDEKTFMISHAGIHPRWLKTYKNEFNKMCEICNTKFEHIDVFLNDILLRPFKKDFNIELSEDNSYLYKTARRILSSRTRTRGGFDTAGSILWADISEYDTSYTQDVFKYEQIVGHTMQYYSVSPFIINGIITCIDCLECFFLDKETDLRRLSDGILAEQVWDANKEERQRRCKLFN